MSEFERELLRSLIFSEKMSERDIFLKKYGCKRAFIGRNKFYDFFSEFINATQDLSTTQPTNFCVQK